MKQGGNDAVQALKWLGTKPDLTALQKKYPEEWKSVEAELTAAIEHKDHARLHALMRPIAQGDIKPGMRLKPSESVEMAKSLVRQRMAAEAVQLFLRGSLPPGSDRVLLFDRLIFRLLFFTGTAHRKLVSNTLFRILWPLVRRRSSLMSVAEGRGVYCFYSRDLVRELARLIDGPCLEIGAGDGALSGFLAMEEGIKITATDDHSWAGKIDYPAGVIKLDAVNALAQMMPEIVICSWPPSGNGFEQAVFRTTSVRRYIVIGSRHKFATGNWRDYQAQTTFAMRLDPRLSGLLLPHDFGGAVYIFDRR